ncbi:carbohydrate ABC transporter permease [Aquamicrobium sp. LC103]|uniref:carbohydrate ABC transporter permease n=1 Tax=Aquamicrobium sp. LC103 TaxID=1120658 RepID=UPI00063EAC55|nr:carbohydrate ABC transporter permease [Aquamicrobium sp. LC103]TKT69250.1 carbohydrate ABC transporter permease [Aquamicrobium sp. LC103]
MTLKHLGRVFASLVVYGLIALAVLFPILWGLLTSFKPRRAILQYPPVMLPEEPTLAHYQRLWDEGVQHFIVNSLIVTSATLVLSLIVGLFAAYALARANFSGRTVIMFVIIAVMSIPIASLLVPTFTMLSQIGLLDTRTGLVLLYTAYQLPIVVWMLMGYIQTLPVELEHAAMIDGHSRLSVIVRIVAPLSAPALVAAGLFIITFAWNDFVVALVMNSSVATRTLPVAVYNFLGFFGRDWGPLLAASMLSIVPVIIVFIAFQKHFVSGMTGGSVKG